MQKFCEESPNLIYGNLPIWKVLRLKRSFQSSGIKVAKIKTKKTKMYLENYLSPFRCLSRGYTSEREGILLKGLMFDV